jgi:tRNA G10  N-methylase Trm11
MNQYIFILGRQPDICLAELKARFGQNSILKYLNNVALLELEALPDIEKLGGTIKIFEVEEIVDSIDKLKLDDGKLTTFKKIGLNYINLNNLEISTLKSKFKVFKRVFFGIKNTISSQESIANELHKNKNTELLFLKVEQKIYSAKLVSIQNLRRYSLRDYGRPRRSSLNGMLPIKLSQIMLNLALNGSEDKALVHDPFCGSGTILMESGIMGLDFIGTDINQEILEDCNLNLSWASKKFDFGYSSNQISIADATNIIFGNNVNYIVTEGYLGKPIKQGSLEEINGACKEVELIMTSFFDNLNRLLDSSEATCLKRICICLPVWFTNEGGSKLIKDTCVIEDLKKMRYNNIIYKYDSDNEMIYHRDNQFVGRRILVLEVKR